ncbi:zinc ribbon domain-containing protein [Natronosalvus vescus]|uniref:zinc ribbon domain-containing protein n=1 Tax=Natronosalvus vescus TaxID=2953881 RepID=UPI002091CC18|nr:zinc ribbon domain-containing protein [Natronosalvus vescus]
MSVDTDRDREHDEPGQVGISAAGAYAPRFRISADEFRDAWGQFQAPGVTEKAVPAADEDALTMAVEAARRALEVGGDSGALEAESGSSTAPVDSIDWLGFASTTPPLEEGDLTARVRAMCGIPADATTHQYTGSTRAGTRALWGAIDALEAGNATRALVVAADAPAGHPDEAIEHAAGAGAAAFVLEVGGQAAIVDRGEYTAAYPGTRFREPGSAAATELGVTAYDRQAFRETTAGAVDSLETDSDYLGAVDAAAIQSPDGKRPYRVAGALGLETEPITEYATVHELGDLGAASVPMTLAKALENGAESILGVSYGSGAGSDAFVLECDGTVPVETRFEDGTSVSYAEYLRERGVVTSGPPSGGGAYVSIPTWKRSLPQRYRLVAGRCLSCDALAFPPEGACPDCGELEGYEQTRLAGEARLEAVTTISQGGAPPEFAEYQSQTGEYAAVIVAFEAEDGSGGTVSAPAMGTDAEPGEFSVGGRVEPTIRRIYTQEGVTRYGFKVRPLE